MTERLQLADWNAVTEELRRFGEAGDVTANEDAIRIDFGSAFIELGRDGYVKSGMALHDFESDEVAAVVVDHDEGSLAIESEPVSYTFRRPVG